MTVEELIEALKKFPSDRKVMIDDNNGPIDITSLESREITRRDQEMSRDCDDLVGDHAVLVQTNHLVY